MIQREASDSLSGEGGGGLVQMVSEVPVTLFLQEGEVFWLRIVFNPASFEAQHF